MRLIKFRAWGIKEKRMIGSVNVFTYKNAPDISIGSDGLSIKANQDKYVLMQFTGLLDKNGKEIYEGDRVSSGIATGDVLFINGRFIVEAHQLGQHELYECLNNIEVIGNIYDERSSKEKK